MSLLEAARNNNVRELYQILRSQGRTISAREKIQAISEAIKNNHQAALFYLWQECIPSIPRELYHVVACKMLDAANHNRTNLIEVMIIDRTFLSALLDIDKRQWIDILAKDGRHELFKQFINNLPMSNREYGRVLRLAASRGEREIVGTLLAIKGNSISSQDKCSALVNAGEEGHLNIARHIVDTQQLNRAQFNNAVRDIGMCHRMSTQRLAVIRYILSAHRGKILPNIIKDIYNEANEHVRAVITEHYTARSYNPSFVRRIFNIEEEIDRECIEMDTIKTWRNVKWSIVNTTTMVVAGWFLGLSTPMLLLAIAGTFTLSMTILWIRNMIKSSCMKSYQDKKATEVAQLSPEIKSAFHEGCDAAQNYLHHTNACSPTSNAFWHPKAFYAGFEAMTLRQDYASLCRELELRETEQLICKIVSR